MGVIGEDVGLSFRAARNAVAKLRSDSSFRSHSRDDLPKTMSASRHEKEQAVNVLPAPVAIWIRERGCAWASDASRPPIASVWQSRNRVASSVGIAASLPRKEPSSRSHESRVSGRWKANTRRDRGWGSRMSRNSVSSPVDS